MKTHTQWLFIMIKIITRHFLKIVEKQQDSTYWPFSFFSFAFLSLKPCKLLNRGNLWLCFLLAATLIHFLSRLPASSSCWSNRPCLCVCSSSLYILTAHEVNDHSIQIISLNFFFFLISETERSLPQLVFPSLQDSHQDPGFLSAAAPPTENENWKEGLNPEVKFSFQISFLWVFNHVSTAQRAPWIISVLNICLLLECFCLIASGNAVLFILCRLS